MEVLLFVGQKDSVFFKAIQQHLPKDCVINEIATNDKSIPKKNLQFSTWPVLFVDNRPLVYGTRAIVNYLFASNDKLLPQNEAGKIESLFFLADKLYTALSPIAAHNQSCLIKEEILNKSKATVKDVLAKIQLSFTGKNTIADIYAQTMVSIASLLGVDVAPLTAEKIEVQLDLLIDEAKRYVFLNLGIPERYNMAPKPTKPMYLSTPIYYVNGLPHIGHLFTTTLVECMAKWYKLRGIDCIYSSGTDEHGIKVQTAAEANGVDPKEWCDKTSKIFFDAFKQFDLNPDVFIRTTDEKHKKIAAKLWNLLLERGYLYEGKYEGWYSKREECFIPENQIREEVVDGVTKRFNTEDGAELEWSSEVNWMFKLSEMQQKLLDWYESNPTCITPKPYYNQCKLLVSRGLPDLSVSRTNVSWGIPVPNDPSQTMYVWIDALSNYLTVAGWDGENQGIWPCDLHTVGKDIVKFHGIYWPAFLIAAGIQPYKRLLVHGWWTKNEEKMSKSLGNTLDPFVLTNVWGLEPVKYYLLREVTLVSDSDYSDLAMWGRYNNDLADILANLVLRIISPKLSDTMVVPECGELTDADKELVENIAQLPGTTDHFMAFGETRNALADIFAALHDINKYLTDSKPWNLKTSDEKRFNTVFYVLLETLRITVVCLYPFMTQTALTILNGLGCADNLDPEQIFKFGLLKPGTQLTNVPVLFPKKPMPEDLQKGQDEIKAMLEKRKGKKKDQE
jgi:methionyl-tRNA synthetase